MLFLDVLPEVKNYCEELRLEVNAMPGKKPSVSAKALAFIGFCITAMVVTGCLSWEKFQRGSCGKYSSKALSWMLRHSRRIPWDYLLIASGKILIKKFGITSGHLVVDDFDRHRSKRTKKIFGAHKVRNKKGGGFVDAQNIVLLCLVTPAITIPVFAWFYRPDPVQRAWRKKDEKLRKKNKIPKSKRPKQPPLDPDFPSKKDIAVKLFRKFKYYFNDIEVKSVSGDSAYLSKQMKVEVRKVFPKVQFISQLRKTQHVVLTRGRSMRVDQYFARRKPQEKLFKLRGRLDKKIYFQSARLFVKSHGKVSHVVAYRYEGEENYRFICAAELTWHAEDIIRAFAFRWLVEVVIEALNILAPSPLPSLFSNPQLCPPNHTLGIC